MPREWLWGSAVEACESCGHGRYHHRPECGHRGSVGTVTATPEGPCACERFRA